MKKNWRFLRGVVLSTFMLGSIGITFAATSSKCKVMVGYCYQFDNSFQHCFDHTDFPECGEVSPIAGADIQINCTDSIVVCNAAISGGDKLYCFSPVPPAAMSSANFPLVTTTPNDICQAFKIGVAQKTDFGYLWCSKT